MVVWITIIYMVVMVDSEAMPTETVGVVHPVTMEAVLPDQLEQTVHKKPGVFDVTHIVAGVEQVAELALKAIEQRIDQFVFGRVVVVKVARTDIEFG